MTVKQLIARLEKEPLDAVVLIPTPQGEMFEVKYAEFAWARPVPLTGVVHVPPRYREVTSKLDDTVRTAVRLGS